jgi:hypothetical protein
MSHGVISPPPRVVPTETVIAGRLIPANVGSQALFFSRAESSSISPQAIVSMGTTFLHNNSNIFKDPMVFHPERWLGEDARGLESFLVPFSKGPRSCLGVKYVYHLPFSSYYPSSAKYQVLTLLYSLAWCELYLIFANVFRKIDMKIYDTT